MLFPEEAPETAPGAANIKDRSRDRLQALPPFVENVTYAFVVGNSRVDHCVSTIYEQIVKSSCG